MARARANPTGLVPTPPASSPPDVAIGRASVEPDVDGWLLEGTDAEEDKQMTVVFRHHVKTAKLEEYRKWHLTITNAQHAFEGFLGITVMEEPSEQPDETIHITIARWKNGACALRWKQSDDRRCCLERLQAMNLHNRTLGARAQARHNTGEDAYFLLGDDHQDSGWLRKRWESFKECLVTWTVVWSHVLIVDIILGYVPGFQNVPLQLRLGVATFFVTSTMHYVTFSRVLWLAKRIGILQ